MKHGILIFYQNTNTKLPIETNFYKHKREYFEFLFQMDNFSATQGVLLVPRRPVLLEEISFHSPFLVGGSWNSR